MLASISGGRFKARDYLSSNLLLLEPEIVSHKTWNQSQMKTFETKNLV
jgi:hypothetical protein